MHTNKTERWEDIPGYEGHYQVSNYGQIRSLLRWNSGRHLYQVRETPLIMSPFDNGNGYRQVMLRRNGNRKPFYVHRLVAIVFCDNPENKSTINHLDHNRANNRADNLQWCTQKENVQYSSYRMRHPKNAAVPKSTNEKYIRFWHGRYELTIHERYIGAFSTLSDAVMVRDKYLKGGWLV